MRCTHREPLLLVAQATLWWFPSWQSVGCFRLPPRSNTGPLYCGVRANIGGNIDAPIAPLLLHFRASLLIATLDSPSSTYDLLRAERNSGSKPDMFHKNMMIALLEVGKEIPINGCHLRSGVAELRRIAREYLFLSQSKRKHRR